MKGKPLAGGLLALLSPFAVAQADTLREQVNRALEEARPALMSHLRDMANLDVRPGELALMLLAAIHDGVPATDAVFAAAMMRLVRANPPETYDLALRLLVMEAFPAYPDREVQAKRDAKELLTHRTNSGAFDYRENAGGWDLSNTQYAALGLRAAKAMGIRIERSVWTKMAKEVGDQQDSYGGFTYRKRNESGMVSYASMTAAGIAVLAICRQALGQEDRQGSTLTKQISRGWQWFGRNATVVGSAGEQWSYYFHYGLERAGILCDVDTIDGKDWYALGAKMLVRDQLAGGGWNSPTDAGAGLGAGAVPGTAGRGQSASTAFAILFLRRKFQKMAGPITPHIVTLAAIGPNSKPDDVDACAEELARRGKEAMPDLLAALRSEILPQRQAAAAALAEIAGESFDYDPAKDADANRSAVKKAELWYLRNR